MKGNIFHMPFVAPTPPETIDLDCLWARQTPICLSNLATKVAKVCAMLFSCSGVPSPLTSYLTIVENKGVVIVQKRNFFFGGLGFLLPKRDKFFNSDIFFNFFLTRERVNLIAFSDRPLILAISDIFRFLR